MRRLITVISLVALAFLLAVPSYAASNYGTDSADIVGKFRGPNGVSPTSVIYKVRYGNAYKDSPSLTSGDVVVWDTNSADGYTISACITSNDASFAGVLVTSIGTADSANINVDEGNVGYICVEGFCNAYVNKDATAGEPLITSGYFSAARSGFHTFNAAHGVAIGANTMSVDIGVLLQSPTVDGQAPVWLR